MPQHHRRQQQPLPKRDPPELFQNVPPGDQPRNRDLLPEKPVFDPVHPNLHPGVFAHHLLCQLADQRIGSLPGDSAQDAGRTGFRIVRERILELLPQQRKGAHPILELVKCAVIPRLRNRQFRLEEKLVGRVRHPFPMGFPHPAGEPVDDLNGLPRPFPVVGAQRLQALPEPGQSDRHTGNALQIGVERAEIVERALQRRPIVVAWAEYQLAVDPDVRIAQPPDIG